MTEETTLWSYYSTSSVSHTLPLLRVPSMILESSSLSLVYPSSCLRILPPLPHLLQRHRLEKQQRCQKRSTNASIVIGHSVGVNIEADMRGRVSFSFLIVYSGVDVHSGVVSLLPHTSLTPAPLPDFNASPQNDTLSFHRTHFKLTRPSAPRRHERATIQMSKVQKYLCSSRPSTATRSDCACERWRRSSSQRSQASDNRAEDIA